MCSLLGPVQFTNVFGQTVTVGSTQDAEEMEATLSAFAAVIRFTKVGELCPHSLMDLKAATKRFGDLFHKTGNIVDKITGGKHPKPFKAHLLFDEFVHFAVRWQSLGLHREDAIESVHVRYNQIAQVHKHLNRNPEEFLRKCMASQHVQTCSMNTDGLKRVKRKHKGRKK